MAAISAEQLTKSFGDVKAVNGIDLEAEEGKVLGLLGPNGAGKTTTIRILSTLLTADSGRALVGGFDVATQPQKVREIIGLTGQYAAVDELLSGRENLRMIGKLLGSSTRQALSRADELLQTFELTDAANRPVKTYSGGMRRRLDLAASLVGTPKILFLDEPTTGLDPRLRLQLWDLIKDLAFGGTTILLTTQYLEEADALADDIIVIDHGKVIATGTSDELKAMVGGQVAEIHPTNIDQVTKAAEVAGRLMGPDAEIEIGDESITVPISGPADLSSLINRMKRNNVELSSVTMRKPSLDEVFLSITGQTPEED